MGKHLCSYISNVLTGGLESFRLSAYFHKSVQGNLHINCNKEELSNKNILDIVAVSFNNRDVIEYQIKLVEKYLLDPYFYTVVDNSNEVRQQNKIFTLCEKYKVGYIKAPAIPLLGISPSMSHGLTLNWVYRNYLRTRKAIYLGFIDHDIFPIRPTKIIPFLIDQRIYGHFQERKEIWYLWPGFCFFNHEFIKNKKVDFLPSGIADTGGQNYYSIYSFFNKSKVIFPKHSYFKLREGDCPQSDLVEYIGDWMHTFNASGWKIIKNKNQKDKLVKDLINKYLNEKKLKHAKN